MKTYIEILRGLREDRDLKQVDIANLLGTTQQQYSKYETGETELPLRAIVALADYYQVSTDYLLGRTQSRKNMDALNKPMTNHCTVGQFMSDALALNNHAKEAVVEYVALHTLKQKVDAQAAATK